MQAAITLVLALVVTPAPAGSVESLAVTELDGRYRIDFRVTVAAPAEAVRRVVFDLGDLAVLTPAVVESRVLTEPGGPERLAVTMRPCITLICMTLDKTSVVSRPSPSRVEFELARADPPAGDQDFLQASESVEVEALAAATALSYSGEFVLRLKIPAWLGVWSIRRVVRRHLGKAVEEVERRAIRLEDGPTR